MSFGFATIPDAGAWRLTGARAPLALVTSPGLAADREGFTALDITIAQGRIASVVPAGTPSLDSDLPALDLDGGIVLPRFVDIHTHLDKGHIWPRCANPDGSFTSALESVAQDREANWSADDLRTRMEFSLRCALAHGTGALRTHLDCIGPQTAISWPVFAEMRDAWRGRIELQAVSLFPADLALQDEAQFRDIVATTARHGGLIGGVTFMGETPTESTERAIDRIVQAAAAEGLDLDLHVDESGSPEARTLERVAEAVTRNRFGGKVLCGHCCSLAQRPDREVAQTIAKVAEARLAVVSLPMCNVYLQDRRAGRTPRWRGVAPLHELRAAGVPVMVASDNTRDPFHAYGDLDMLEVYREATRILHLDHAGPDWPRAFAATPADIMNLDRHGRIEAGDAADLVLFRARTLMELLARPHTDRTVLLGGQAIDTTLPDYRELDECMRRPV
jgi:cytosine/creatinine deaminase